MNERQMDVVTKAYPNYFDLVSRTEAADWWVGQKALSPVEFDDRILQVKVTTMTALPGYGVAGAEQAMVFTNTPSLDQAKSMNLFTATATLAARYARLNTDRAAASMVPIAARLDGAVYKSIPHLETGAFFEGVQPGVSIV
jgi:hypothetical protein